MNEEHAVRLLSGGMNGVAEWNARRQKGETMPDLREANLAGVDLEGTRSGPVRPPFGLIRSADLSGLRLERASFFGANLSFVQFANADLSRADFQYANLTGVNFKGANLTDAALLWANLHRARFKQAKVSGTRFGGNVITTDMSEAVDLHLSKHYAPSQISADALLNTAQPLPTSFLRDCGVAEVLIDQLSSLRAASEPFQYDSVFISFSHGDEVFCTRLHACLQENKLRVFFAPEDMKGGRTLEEQIDEAIHHRDRLLLVLSEASMRSDWVRREIKKARERERHEDRAILYPIRIVEFDVIQAWECLDSDTGEDLAETVRSYYIPDFSNWTNDDAFERAVVRLVNDLKAGKPTPVSGQAWQIDGPSAECSDGR